MNPHTPTRVYLKCYKFSLLGTLGVGKTSLAMQFAMESFFGDGTGTNTLHSGLCEGTDPGYVVQASNVEDSFRKQLVVDDVLCLVETLDCEDGEEYLGLRDAYIRNSHGFVFVYSITSRASFDRIEHLHNSVQRLKGEHPVGIIVGNKRDKSNQRVVTTEEGARLAATLGCEFIETSAKTAENVNKIFPNLIRVIRLAELAQQSGDSSDLTHRSGDRRADRNVISGLFGRLRRR